jgi:uncharacterized protein DUF6496
MPFDAVMEKYRQGRLKSSQGTKVTNPKQAYAIGKSYERKPEKKKGFSSISA